jgi:glycosyltransferase involved in cell wall biosynthesis
MALDGIPAISAVSAGAQRPFWSVMIPTYNPRAEFFVQALDAVLAQDPGTAEMEIAVVDDCSAGDVRDLARGGARERVAWHRHDRHVGIGRNWNACIDLARGEWVHILHQDDLVLPGFYDRLRAGAESSAAIGAAFCRDVVIDAQGERIVSQPLLRATPGIVEDWIQRIFIGLELRASALVVRRSVYEALGGFRLDLQYALDWDMWKRIAAAYPLWYDPAPLARYRRHAASASSAFVRSGANIAEIRRSIELSGAALQPDLAAMVSKRARQAYTKYAVLTAWRALRAHEYAASFAQVREARKLTSTLSVLLAIGRFLPGARRVR